MCPPRVCWTLFFSAVLCVVPFSGSVHAQDVRVGNVEAYQQGKNVIIEYDLNGDRRVTYDIELRLSRDGGDTFAYAPSAVSGAVGSGTSSGNGKEIVWAVLQDFPEGLEGDDYQFKVLAEQEGTIPTRQPHKPTAQRDRQKEQSSEESSEDDSDEEGFLRLRAGVGLTYNTRETIQPQFYDGYQFSASIKPKPIPFALRMNYRITTGTFNQSSTLDLDLLYDGGFYYIGASAGIFDFDENVFEGSANKYNLNLVSGLGVQIGGIYPYIEYRFPFSRNLRDDSFGWGILYTF